MAYATTDYYIRPEDGWVKVATNPASCMIRPTDFFPFRMAITASGAPAVEVTAAGTITFTGASVEDDTVTIGSDVYTFKDVPTLDFEVPTDLVAADAATALGLAIETWGTAPVAFNVVGATVVLSATARGTAGNAVVLTEDLTNGTVTGSGTLEGGVNGVHGLDYGRGGDGLRETIVLPTSMTAEVYLRIDRPPSSSPDSMHFGVVTS